MSIKLSLVVALLANTGVLAETFSNIKVDGYVRAAYQNHSDDVVNTTSKDNAIGGKLHIETASVAGISAEASFYTSQTVNHHDNGGVPFFDVNSDAYSILGEAYLQGTLGNTTLKIGRQEIDTPYADTDDIGMIPNTFEAAILVNTDITNTTIMGGFIQKMAGVDAGVLDKFTNTDMSDGISMLGVIYEGIENLGLQGWYYDIKDTAGDRAFTYLEAAYGVTSGAIGYNLAVQYATQDAFPNDAEGDAKISGISAGVSFENMGLSLNGAYNKSNGTSASNGFGGGAFFTSCEDRTIDGIQKAKATRIGAEFDAGVLGVKGLSLAVSRFDVENKAGLKAEETDFVVSYAFNDVTSIDFITSDTADDINTENFTNTRIFINYNF